MVNQAKPRSCRNAPEHKCGFEVPRDRAHAMRLNESAGGTKWQHLQGTRVQGQATRRVRRKSHLVADHLTAIPTESMRPGVVSLRGTRLLWVPGGVESTRSVGNRYREYLLGSRNRGEDLLRSWPRTRGAPRSRSCDLRGAVRAQDKWPKLRHERFTDCLRDAGLEPPRFEPGAWMRTQERRHL
jgi:hypothetical protein